MVALPGKLSSREMARLSAYERLSTSKVPTASDRMSASSLEQRRPVVCRQQQLLAERLEREEAPAWQSGGCYIAITSAVSERARSTHSCRVEHLDSPTSSS